MAEHLPYANRPPFRVEEMADIDVKANRGHTPEFALISLRRFRPCFATAQSKALSKVPNALIRRRFPASRAKPASARLAAQDLPAGTAEIMTKACASGQSSVMERSIRASNPSGVRASSRASAP